MTPLQQTIVIAVLILAGLVSVAVAAVNWGMFVAVIWLLVLYVLLASTWDRYKKYHEVTNTSSQAVRYALLKVAISGFAFVGYGLFLIGMADWLAADWPRFFERNESRLEVVAVMLLATFEFSTGRKFDDWVETSSGKFSVEQRDVAVVEDGRVL